MLKVQPKSRSSVTRPRVEARLKALSSAGATEFLASIFPVGNDPDASVTRTREFLKLLVGRV